VSLSPVHVEGFALLLIQEGMRGVVRLPTGTAHALDSSGFPMAVMGKTGTTNEFRDALFVGSTYGSTGITIAVRIGFDDNRSLGAGETGGRVALPVFREVALRVYAEKLVGPAPQFPAQMEQSNQRIPRTWRCQDNRSTINPRILSQRARNRGSGSHRWGPGEIHAERKLTTFPSRDQAWSPQGPHLARAESSNSPQTWV
jgi:membrane carboxypeptidase/penicillin-binding protein